MERKTYIAIYNGDTQLFTTDSFPVVPEVGEKITVKNDNNTSHYTVARREFLYQKYSDSGVRESFVILYVDKL